MLASPQLANKAAGHDNSGYAPSLFRLHPSIQVQKSGLLFFSNPSLRSWEAIGEQLVSLAESTTWWLADWLAYGETTFRDRYLEAIRKTNLNYQTLRNYAWVARRFELSRRRDALSFGHHAEVAGLEQPEQDYWLRKAEELGWSRNRLRGELKASLQERHANTVQSGAENEAASAPSQRDIIPGEADSFNMLQLEVTQEQIALFEAVAEARHRRLQEWAVGVLEEAARKEGRSLRSGEGRMHFRLGRTAELRASPT